jgi:DNA-binding NarL/FixJ family response regulator
MRAAAASVPILLMGSSKQEGDFLQCVRAGVRGYLWRDASAEDVLNAIRAVLAREAVCPGALCSALSTILNAKHRGYHAPARAGDWG